MSSAKFNFFFDKYKFGIFLVFVLFYQVLCSVKGFDLSDEGWAMYFYQQIFKNPDTVVAQMPYWLTGVIGGGVYKLWPNGGFLAMRLVGVAMNTSILIISYFFLRKHFNTTVLLIGLLIQVLIVSGDPKPFGYNSLTAFFAVIGVLLLYSALDKQKLFYSFLSGFIIGLNVFVRIPNIVQLAFILIIPFYYFLYKRQGNWFFNNFVWTFTGGVLLGMLLTVKAMMLVGHWDYFIASFASTVNSISDSSNSHQFGRMIGCYLRNYGGILEFGGLLTGFAIIYVVLYKRILLYVPSYKWLRWLLSIFIVLLNCSWLIKKSNILRSKDMYAIHFLAYLAIIIILLSHKKKDRFTVMCAFISLLMIVFIPAGSDMGIQTMWTSSWIALPMGLAYLYSCCLPSKQKNILQSKTNSRFIGFFSRLDGNLLRNFFSIITLSIIISFFYQNYARAYYDPAPAIKKHYKINNRFCNGIYTINYRASLINELLPELNKYVKPGAELMAYDFIPGLNYMTDTKSFIPNAWIWCYSGKEFERQLHKAIAQGKKLPIIVRQHCTTTNQWGEFDSHFYDENKPDDWYFNKKRTNAINNFVKEYKYKTVWSNKNFEILLPGN